jgi:ADP-heptose:LPS heptosyltransferase
MASTGFPGFRQQREGGGLARFVKALEAVPDGGTGQIWIRMPIKLGDVVMALPSIFAVKDTWEKLAEARGIKLRFTLLGKPSITLFQEAIPEVFAACLVDGETPFRSPLGMRKSWGKDRPLAVINFSKSDRIKLAAWIGGVPVRAGISDGGFNWCYQFCEPYEKSIMSHRVFRYLSLTRWLAGPDAHLRFEILDPVRYGGRSVLDVLKDAGWDGGPYVVFGPNADLKNPERRWFPLAQPWLRVAELARREGITAVLAGGPEHLESLARMASASGTLCLAGKTTLPQLLALTAGAVGTIAVDTGIAHVAAATGKPTVVIFGDGREHWDLPCGPRVIALRGNPAGRSLYPEPPGTRERAMSPWGAATGGIAAERAWAVLNCLARE